LLNRLLRSEPVQDRILLGLVLLGLVLRLGVGLATLPDRKFLGDEVMYIRSAAELVRTGEFDTDGFVRPPLYFVLVAGVHTLPLDFRTTLIVLQCLAAALTTFPLYRLGRRIAGRRTALFSSAFFLLNPTLIAYASLLWPETFYLLLVSLVFDGVSTLTPEQGRRGLLLGALTGLTMLLKPVFGLFTPLLALWWWQRFGFRPALRASLMFGVAAALTIAPWVVRNQIRYGGGVLLDDQSAYNLWVGNDPRPPHEVHYEYGSTMDPALRTQIGYARAVELISADPGGFLARAARRGVNMWGLEFFVLRHALFRGYGPITANQLIAVFWMLQLGYAATLFCAAVGLAQRPRPGILSLMLVHAAAFTVVVASMVGTTRFTMPFAPLLSIAAGIGATHWGADWLSRRSLIAIGIALLLVATSASRPIFREIATGDPGSSQALRSQDLFYFRY